MYFSLGKATQKSERSLEQCSPFDSAQNTLPYARSQLERRPRTTPRPAYETTQMPRLTKSTDELQTPILEAFPGTDGMATAGLCLSDGLPAVLPSLRSAHPARSNTENAGRIDDPPRPAKKQSSQPACLDQPSPAFPPLACRPPIIR